MPPRERAKVDGAASPPDAGGDRISALPDDVLHHVLSFLPAEDVMRTCLLARRNFHIYRIYTGLYIEETKIHTEIVSIHQIHSKWHVSALFLPHLKAQQPESSYSPLSHPQSRRYGLFDSQ
jgi:hypothetical protein